MEMRLKKLGQIQQNLVEEGHNRSVFMSKEDRHRNTKQTMMMTDPDVRYYRNVANGRGYRVPEQKNILLSVSSSRNLGSQEKLINEKSF